MSVESTVRAVTTYRLTEMKQRGEKIAMLTSYDYSMARIVDAAGIDVILVGDSAANVMAGYETTLPITLDMMIYHARSVVRAVSRALVVVDLPFGTYQGNSKVALDSAIRIMKETEADAVKIEGGEEILESVNRILSAGIPVMGHLGLTPQSIHKFGTYSVRAKEEAEAAKLVRDAHLLSDAGCFGIVLEKIPAALAARVTSEISAPTIGIGAGNGCDGQVLVIHDMLASTRVSRRASCAAMPTCILLCRTPCRSISRTSSRAISPTGRSSTDPAGCAGRRDGIISIPDPEAGDFSCPGSRRREDAPDCCPGIPGAGCSLWLVRDCAGGFPGRGAGGCPGRRRVYLPVAGLAGRCPGGSGFCPHPAALINC